MDERNVNSFGCSEQVCIQAQQIYDSCRSKECLECMRVYLTESGQETINNATEVKCRKSEVIWVFSDIEPMTFNRGYYTVSLTFFFRIMMDAYIGINRPIPVEGLSVFNKKVVLFGSEGSAKTFSSTFEENSFDPQLWQKTNLPKATVEVVDPICLALRLTDNADGCASFGETDIDILSIPDSVRRVFDDRFIMPCCTGKRVYASLGLFSIVRLERNVQLLIPSYDFCIPDKECVYSTDDDPCNLFENISFPVDEFFPPLQNDFNPENTPNIDCE